MILSKVKAFLGLSWDDFGAARACLGAILGYVGAMLGPFWEVLGWTWAHFMVYGLRFRVLGLEFDHHNAPPFEMPKSLLPYACVAKTFVRKTKMISSIEITYMVNMQKSLSLYACAAKTLAGHHISGKISIGVGRDEW